MAAPPPPRRRGAAPPAPRSPRPAVAHVTFDTTDGRYAVEVGFQNEPAYLGQPNALYVKVSAYRTGGTEPVDGLADSLVAEVEKEGQSRELPLVPQGEGEYL